jgi:hypothetical protein
MYNEPWRCAEIAREVEFPVSTRPSRSLLRSFAVDESANALTDYAIVLSTLCIIAIVAFNFFGTTSTSVVGNNQSSFSNTAAMSYQH